MRIWMPFVDDVVGFLALDVGDKADAAGVVLVARVVETLRSGGRRELTAGELGLTRGSP